MATAEESANMRKTFNDTGCSKKSHAEGTTFHTIPAAVYIVLDEFISTVCSSCLKVHQSTDTLQRCPKCKFVRYCSHECRAKDWKKFHKDECPILNAVWKACPNQSTSFARLFVRSGLKVNNDLKESGMPPAPPSLPDFLAVMEEHNAQQCLTVYHKPQNCRELFDTWKPVLEALDRHHNTNDRRFGCFMNALTDLIENAMLFYPNSKSGFSTQPVAYCTFLCKMTKPSCRRSAVYVPVIDPVNGLTLQIRAVRPLEAGEMVYWGDAQNLLASPIILKSQRTYSMDQRYLTEVGRMYMMERVEILCHKCGHPASVMKPDEDIYPLALLESIRFVVVGCRACMTAVSNYSVCDLLIAKLAELTTPKTRGIVEADSELVNKIDELKDVISSLRPMVAPTSFALGILYRELALTYEELGRLDKCVEAYKMVFPIVEKHLDKYDQNIFDGLARLIVFHLDKNEVTESLPYIEMAWERLQFIPGKDSFDFHVIDKLRKAIRGDDNFSFSNFCTVAPE